MNKQNTVNASGEKKKETVTNHTLHKSTFKTLKWWSNQTIASVLYHPHKLITLSLLYCLSFFWNTNIKKNTDNGSHFYHFNTFLFFFFFHIFSTSLAVPSVVWLTICCSGSFCIWSTDNTLWLSLLIYFKQFTSESFWFCEMVETAFLRPTSVWVLSA